MNWRCQTPSTVSVPVWRPPNSPTQIGAMFWSAMYWKPLAQRS